MTYLTQGQFDEPTDPKQAELLEQVKSATPDPALTMPEPVSEVGPTPQPEAAAVQGVPIAVVGAESQSATEAGGPAPVPAASLPVQVSDPLVESKINEGPVADTAQGLKLRTAASAIRTVDDLKTLEELIG